MYSGYVRFETGCVLLIPNEVIFIPPLRRRGGYTVLPLCVCLSVRPSVCPSVTNFRRSFLNNYSSQMFEILTHSSLGYAIWWDSFLCESDADFLFISASVRRVYINFRSSFLSNYSSQMLEILTHSSSWHAIWWDSFLCESDADFLFIRASVRRMYLKFLSQFL